MYKDEVEEALRLMEYLGTILGGPVDIRNSEETYTKFWKELYPYPGGDFMSQRVISSHERGRFGF